MIKFLKFIPVQLTFFLILGILIGSSYNFQPSLLVKIIPLFLVLLLVLYIYTNRQLKSNLLFTGLVFLIAFFIGISAITFKNQLHRQQHYSNAIDFKTASNTVATIVIKKILKPSFNYFKYEVEVIQLEHAKTIGKILINIEKDSAETILNN